MNMFPARAGMNRYPESAPTIFTYVPRTSGDEPEWVGQGLYKKKCSPHERG